MTPRCSEMPNSNKNSPLNRSVFSDIRSQLSCSGVGRNSNPLLE